MSAWLTTSLRYPSPPTSRTVSRALRQDSLAWALLHASPDGMLLVGDTGRIVFANRTVEELFGYERGALLDRSVEILVPDAFRETHVAHRDGYAHEPYTRRMGDGLRVFGKRSDGTEMSLDVSLSPLVEDSCRLVIATVRSHDDGERERLAHDVLDTVIREVFAIGLSLHGGLQAGNDALTARTRQAIDALDLLVRDIRTRFFDPSPEHPGS